MLFVYIHNKLVVVVSALMSLGHLFGAHIWHTHMTDNMVGIGNHHIVDTF